MPPERFKPREAWSVAEILEHAKTGAKPETDEYRAAVRGALERDGLDVPDAYAPEKADEEKSVEDFITEIKRGS